MTPLMTSRLRASSELWMTRRGQQYRSDGWSGYIDAGYPGLRVRNAHDKSNPYTVEGVHAGLRHYLPVLARRGRCFARRLETLQAVMEFFVDACNRFGGAKRNYRLSRQSGE
jgi:IS1 family transposase